MIIEEECCTHGIEYSLGKGNSSSYDENSEPKVSVTCFECRYPTYIYTKIQNRLIERRSDNNDMIQDIINVTNNCAKKVRLYMAHHVQCKNQSITIEQIKQDMIDR